MLYNIEGKSNLLSNYVWQSNFSTQEKLNVNIITDQDRLFINKINEVINNNINDHNFGNNKLAKEMHLSVSQLFRKVKALTNKSPSNYISSIRLTIAKKMLESTLLTIAEIAFKTGFNDPSYFTRAFVKEFGITPGKARKK